MDNARTPGWNKISKSFSQPNDTELITHPLLHTAQHRNGEIDVGDDHASMSMSGMATSPHSPTDPLPPDINSTSNDDVRSNHSFPMEQLLFFGCGLGSSLCYIATLSSLVYFTIVYGPDSFVDLNLAVYLPMLPVSLAQARWDQKCDQHFRSRSAFCFRAVVGFCLSLIGTIRMMIHSSRGDGSLTMLIVDSTFQGFGGALLYGLFYQMASFVGTGDGRRFKACVSAGVQASAFIVLAASLGTKFGVNHNAMRFSSFLWVIIVVESICFTMCVLLLMSPLVASSMIRRDRSIRTDLSMSVGRCNIPSQNDAIEDQPFEYSEVEDRSSQSSASDETEDRFFYYRSMGDRSQNSAFDESVSSTNPQISYFEIWEYSKQYCFILFINLVPSFLVGSWFTKVETNWIALAQVLFYVRIGSDLLGRIATIVILPGSVGSLAQIAGLRLIPVMLFFGNSRRCLLCFFGIYESIYSDIISIVLVAIIAFLSGYLVTGCYQLAPRVLPSDVRDANVAKQASLLTIAFSVAAIGDVRSLKCENI